NNPSVHADMSSGKAIKRAVWPEGAVSKMMVITFAVLFQQDGDALQECGLMRAWRMLGQVQVLVHFLVQMLRHHPAHCVASLLEMLIRGARGVELQHIHARAHRGWGISHLGIP